MRSLSWCGHDICAIKGRTKGVYSLIWLQVYSLQVKGVQLKYIYYKTGKSPSHNIVMKVTFMSKLREEFYTQENSFFLNNFKA